MFSFMVSSRTVCLERENLQKTFLEKIKIRSLYSINIFPEVESCKI